MQVAPERALHVGDSYRADVVGARRLGIKAVLIAREPTEETPFLFPIVSNGLFAGLSALSVIQPYLLPLATGMLAGDAIAKSMLLELNKRPALIRQ